jgi:protoporphyrinogen/coproporphyrinogen III oxidase
MSDKHVAVIGGGLSGLAAAHRLQALGARVTLLETEAKVGGRAVTDELNGHRIDTAAQLFGSMYERFAQLVREVGLGGALVQVPGRDALWRDGRAHEVVYGSVSSMIASGGLPFRTKMRLGTTYVPFLTRHGRSLQIHAPEKAAEAGLDDESIAAWGEREIDRDFVASLVYPQLGAYYGSDPRDTSAGFYHILAKHGMDVTLFALAGGVGTLAERLRERIGERGGEVRLGTGVQRLQLAGGVRITAAGREERFDAAVCAVPAPVAEGMLEGAPETLMRWLGQVRYRPAVTLALLLDRPVRARYFGLSFPQGENRWTAAVAVQQNKGVRLVPPGKGLLLAFSTPEGAPDLIDRDSGQVLERMLPEVARAFPGLGERVERARVYRWPLGSPVFFPGYLRSLAEFRTRFTSDSTLALAGDYLFGPSVEGAVSSGLAAAEQIAR